MQYDLTPYYYNGATYCGGCVAHVLVYYEPWKSMGLSEDDLADDNETDLLMLATAAGIDGTDPAATYRTGFPLRLTAPPHPPTFCGHCYQWFATAPTQEGGTMPIESHMTRHASALLHPESPEEQTLSSLLTELARLSDRYRDDQQAIPAIESLGSAAVRLLNFPTGRIDQSTYEKQVRDEVTRAGGDAEDL